MPIPTPRVQIGLLIADFSTAPYFVLGDPTKGLLGNADYRLAGELIDVTDRVRSISINRGRNRAFADYPSGEVVITMNNFDRAFDPLYTSSPFFGSIVPRREIIITSNNITLFTGWVEDWNLFYSKDGESLVDAIASDATIILNKRPLAAFTPTEQTSGARISEVLAKPEVSWPTEQSNIQTGYAIVGTQPVSDGTNALQYIQKVAESELGSVFIDRTGVVNFKQRNNGYSATTLPLFSQDNNEGVPYDNLQVVYGSELLYNEVQASREGGGTAVASNTDSQDLYGLRDLTVDGLLYSNDDQLVNTVVNYATIYSEPEYRFEGFEVKLHKLSPEDQNTVLDIELASAIRIKFTPNGIGSEINRLLEVIKINHIINPQEHIIEFGFRSLEYPSFVLDSLVGTLDSGVLGW